MPARKALPLVLLFPVLGACATSEGLRSDPAAAVLGSSGAVVQSIDDRNVRVDGPAADEARFELPPGRHAVTITLDTGSSAASAGEGAQVLCFAAEAGHSYLARRLVQQNRSRLVIIDEDSGESVQTGCAEREHPNAPAPAVAVASEAPLAPAPEPAPAVFRGENRPGTGLYLEVGFFFGGDPLYQVRFQDGRVQSLSAGRGVGVSGGGLWTPLWTKDHRVGFGVGAGAGWKYDTIEAMNGSVELTRLPVSASVHALVRLDGHWFALVKGGLGTEVGGQLSGSGFAGSTRDNLTSSWGLIGEVGLYRRLDRAALGGGLRYSRLTDRFAGSEVDASSLGILASVQYTF